MIRDVIRKTGDFMKKYEFCQIFQFAVLNGLLWMLMSIAYLCYMDLQKHSAYGITYSVMFTVGIGKVKGWPVLSPSVSTS